MINFLNFLAEDLHPELFDILDSNTDIHSKHKKITQHIRKLIANGIDTGLEGERAKKGSSRAVYFPKEEKEINIDGKKAKIKTALKIAFPGILDKPQFIKKAGMLGELQNNAEASEYFNDHSILKKGMYNNEFVTNEEHGILAPIINTSHDDSWLEMGKVNNITSKKFRQLTKTESHPEGLNHTAVEDILFNEHRLKYGQGRQEYTSEEQAVLNHPFTQKLMHLIENTDIHPGDIFGGGITPGNNFGVWTHPHTGKEYPVIRDYGFTDSVAKEYIKRRRQINE